MFKAMFFLYRRADFDFARFRGYSEEVHIPIVAAVPGLRRYVVNYAIANPTGAQNACDAVAELCFDSIESFQAALGTAEGAAAIQDQGNYLNVERTHMQFVDEHVIS